MRRYLQPSLLPVPLGLLIGVALAATVVNTQPAILGWVLCVGLGLMGGALIAGLASGDAMVSGPAPKRGSTGDAPWLNPSPEDDER